MSNPITVIDLGQSATGTGIHVTYAGKYLSDDSFIDVEAIAYHRNGVCGEPFYVVCFSAMMDDGPNEAPKAHRFVATCFFDYDPETDRLADYSMPRVAMLDRDLLAAGDIAFGSNSWRGDRFSGMLAAACQAWSDR
jgi:hypothetical protein